MIKLSLTTLNNHCLDMLAEPTFILIAVTCWNHHLTVFLQLLASGSQMPTRETVLHWFSVVCAICLMKRSQAGAG